MTTQTTAQTAADILEEAAKTFRDRGAVYKNQYRNVGKMMVCLFPSGITLVSSEDHMRFHLFMLLVVKLTRYAVQFENGGHQDSIRDAAVYAAMVEMVDQEISLDCVPL